MSFQNDKITSIPAPLPTDYDRQYSFSDWERLNPGVPYPAAGFEAEFNAIEESIDETQARLRLIQRDDGALRNNSVGLDQLTTEAQVGVQTPADWQEFTAYTAGNSVIYNNVAWYVAAVSHNSSDDFVADLGAGNWVLLLDFSAFYTTESEHWANFPVDQLVPEGDLVDDYSALHHATKAGESAVTASDAAATATAAAATLNLPAPTEIDRILIGNGADAFVWGPQFDILASNASVAQRDANGRLRATDPVGFDDVATKNYVDGLILDSREGSVPYWGQTVQEDTDTALAATNEPTLTCLTRDWVLLADAATDLIRGYEHNGTQYVAAGTLSIAGSTAPSLSALSGTRAAYMDNLGAGAILRTIGYDGATVSVVGNTLSLGGNYLSPVVVAYSGDRVFFVVYNGSSSEWEMGTATFDGTDWTLGGDVLFQADLGDLSSPAMAVLPGGVIAIANTVSADFPGIRLYGWEAGAGFSVDGRFLSRTLTNSSLASLNREDLILADRLTESVEVIKVSESGLAVVSASFSVSGGIDTPAVSCRDGLRVAYFDELEGQLRTYKLEPQPGGLPNTPVNPAF